MNIGPRIKQLREGASWSLQNLADRVGTSKTYIWQLENQDGHKISLYLALQFSDTFCLTIQEFLYASSLASKSLIAAQELRRLVAEEFDNSRQSDGGKTDD